MSKADELQILAIMALGMATSAMLLEPTIKLAFLIGLTDRPDQTRKLHARATAYMGGAILWLCMMALLFGLGGIGGFGKIAPLVVAFSILFGIGIVDDARNLAPRIRLVFQALAVAIIVGDRFVAMDMQLSSGWDVAIGAIAVLVGVGVVNAFNLIDGLDGLALGLGLLVATPLFLSNWGSGDMVGVALALAFVSACIGLLKGNLYPARIFLGDAGSLLIGGVIFALALRMPGSGVEPLPPMLSGLVPLAACVPVVDMLVVMGRRRMRGQGMFQGDRTHLHHRLQRVGMAHEEVVGWIHGAMSLVVLVQLGLRMLGASDYWILATLMFWVPVYLLLSRLEAMIEQEKKGERHEG